jgi:hypothetical protein
MSPTQNNQDRPALEASEDNSLVNGNRLLEVLWRDKQSRPGYRTLQKWKSLGYIPFTKVGKSVYYNPAKVRRAIERQFEVSEIGL